MDEELPLTEEGFVTVEISGLSVYAHHGVTAAERTVGQRIVFDISFELEHCDAVVTDRVEDTVDYAAACELVSYTASERSYKTLERLCKAVSGQLLERFTAARAVTVRAAKPEPPLALSVDRVAVELDSQRPEEGDEDDQDTEAE